MMIDEKKKKVGRPGINDIDPLFDKKIVKAYNHYKSLRRVGKLFGLSHQAVWLHLERLGIDKSEQLNFRGHTGKSTVYFKMINFEKLYNVPLPRSYRDIAKLLNVKHISVSKAFYRLRQQLKEDYKGIPDLRLLPYPGVYCEGTANDKKKVGIYLNKDVVSYDFKPDKFLQFTMLTIRRKDDPITYRIIIKNISLFREKVKDYFFNYVKE